MGVRRTRRLVIQQYIANRNAWNDVFCSLGRKRRVVWASWTVEAKVKTTPFWVPLFFPGAACGIFCWRWNRRKWEHPWRIWVTLVIHFLGILLFTRCFCWPERSSLITAMALSFLNFLTVLLHSFSCFLFWRCISNSSDGSCWMKPAICRLVIVVLHAHRYRFNLVDFICFWDPFEIYKKKFSIVQIFMNKALFLHCLLQCHINGRGDQPKKKMSDFLICLSQCHNSGTGDHKK